MNLNNSLKIDTGNNSNEFSRKTSVFKQPNLTEYENYMNFNENNEDIELDEDELVQRINNLDRETFGKRGDSMAGSSMCKLEPDNLNEQFSKYNNCNSTSLNPSFYIGKEFSNQFYNNKYASNSANAIENYHTDLNDQNIGI